MSIITLSLSYEEQKQIMGYGCVGEEMLIDFETYYTDQRQRYIDNNVLSKMQLQILDEFDQYLNRFNNQNEDFYWDAEELKHNQLWIDLREEAKKVVLNVFGNGFTIELEREIDGRIEITKRKLIREQSKPFMVEK